MIYSSLYMAYYKPHILDTKYKKRKSPNKSKIVQICFPY